MRVRIYICVCGGEGERDDLEMLCLKRLYLEIERLYPEIERLYFEIERLYLEMLCFQMRIERLVFQLWSSYDQ